ncbi:hypothetical protein Fot_32564 [Forsythia ovata]|uniref:Uncharacterized protein n=1 Tax=Forsythia ovata TaxID=205694 RepID=A0ABD1T866_9LAMI
MDLVEGWVKYVMELSRGHEDPEADPDYWAEVPTFFLTKKDLAVISRLYFYKGDFYGLIGSDHLFVKHNLIKKQGSSSLPKIGMASLASKKIPRMMKKKSFANDQKRTLVGLSLKGGEKDQDTAHVSTYPRVCKLWHKSKIWGPREWRRKKTKEAGSEVGGSSKRSQRNEDDLEVLEEEWLSKKARKPRTVSSRSHQNMVAEEDGVPVILEEEDLP